MVSNEGTGKLNPHTDRHTHKNMSQLRTVELLPTI